MAVMVKTLIKQNNDKIEKMKTQYDKSENTDLSNLVKRPAEMGTTLPGFKLSSFSSFL